jgi:predicted Ser/Thr protein kinase
MSESATDKNMPTTCPQCGVTLPTGALEGLCPACLLKQGAETGPPPASVPFQPPTLEEVARLFPQLQILAFIGKGGMGAVYKARQPALDRLVALKILPPQAAGGPGFAERFNREARALARLNHPNIVAVHEFGQAGGLPFFIMEFVDGLTLRQLEQAARLSPAEALRIVPQICEALQYAHDEGIVHRDIKPENILIDKKGRVKIADFGIAKILVGSLFGVPPSGGILGPPKGGTPSATGVIGTPHYMAPEQLEKPQSVDHRADIFSLGVVFYEMLTGQLPLGRFAPPSRKVQIDARLDEVVLRALEREPELRYQHAAEVKTEIDTITSSPRSAGPSGENTRPRMSQSAPSPAGSLLSSRQVFAWLALGLLIVGLLAYPFLTAIRANDDGTVIFGLLCLALALVFGLVGWRERLGRVVAIAVLGLLTLGVAVACINILYTFPHARAKAMAADRERRIEAVRRRLGSLQALEANLETRYTTNNRQVKANLLEIEAVRAELKRLEEPSPSLRGPEPTELRTFGFTNAAGTSAAGDFMEYPVNKTWAELGDMFDLSTPERAVGSFGIRGVGGADIGALVNKATIGGPRLPEGSIKLTVPANEAAFIPSNTVVEVALYRDDLAGVITWLPATNHFITECLSRQDGEWKIYLGDDLDFTLTKEAAVRQFEKEAENCRQKILALASQPPPDLSSTAGALSNGIVSLGGALGNAMQQLMGSMQPFQRNLLSQPGQPGISNTLPAPVQQIPPNILDFAVQQALSAARAGSSGGSGSFTIGPSPFGPATTYKWTKDGTNFTVTTNQ